MFFSRCPNITSLDLSGCDNLLKPGLVILLQKIPLNFFKANTCENMDQHLLQVKIHSTVAHQDSATNKQYQIYTFELFY